MPQNIQQQFLLDQVSEINRYLAFFHFEDREKAVLRWIELYAPSFRKFWMNTHLAC
ncbi:MAG: hypothetical protein HQM11_05475 [SAR324 cluster bacterium]|nr:hypothetical protein [SAR324 cluster bacterium]